MKIKSSDLRAALSRVSLVVGKRTSLPILSMLRLEAAANVLSIAASDLNCYLSARVECDGDLAPICVNANTLIGLSRSAGLDVELTLKGERLVCASGWTANLGTLPAIEFPALPAEKYMALGIIVPKDLAECIKAVSWAAGDDPSDYAHSGVWVKAGAKQIKCAATNRKKAAFITRLGIAGAAEFIVPGDYTTALCNALEGDAAIVEVGEKHISVAHHAGCCVVILIDAQFSGDQYHKMLSAKHTEVGKVPAWQILEAIQSALLCANGDDFVRIDLTPGAKEWGLAYTGQSNQFAVTLPITCEGVPMRFDAKIAKEVLSHVGDHPEMDTYDNMIRFRHGESETVLALVRIG